MNGDLKLAIIVLLACIALMTSACSNDVNHWEACCGDGLCHKTVIYPDDELEAENGPIAACWVSNEKSCGVCQKSGEQ